MVNISVMIVSVVMSHAPLPHYETVSEDALVEAAQKTWEVSEEKARILVSGARLGGQLADVHPGWLLSMAYHESRFNWGARGDCKKGKKRCLAYGLCQIHYHTAKGVVDGLRREDLLNPFLNLIVAALLYKKYIKRDGRDRAHIAYACGRGCKGATTTPTFHKRYNMAKKFMANINRRKR